MTCSYHNILSNVGSLGCSGTSSCHFYVNQINSKLAGKYFFSTKECESNILECAYIDLKYQSFEEYFRQVKIVSKGSSIRNANIALKHKMHSKIIDPNNYIESIVEINQSKEIRCGKKMTNAYCRSVDELREYSCTAQEYKKIVCDMHYDLWWGCFTPNNKLVGYIRLRRNGNYFLYAQILGHGDYLSKNIMYNLHFSVMKWVFSKAEKKTIGIDFLIYAAWKSGGEDLQRWKRKLGFKPGYFKISEEERV